MLKNFKQTITVLVFVLIINFSPLNGNEPNVVGNVQRGLNPLDYQSPTVERILKSYDDSISCNNSLTLTQHTQTLLQKNASNAKPSTSKSKPQKKLIACQGETPTLGELFPDEFNIGLNNQEKSEFAMIQNSKSKAKKWVPLPERTQTLGGLLKPQDNTHSEQENIIYRLTEVDYKLMNSFLSKTPKQLLNHRKRLETQWMNLDKMKELMLLSAVEDWKLNL